SERDACRQMPADRLSGPRRQENRSWTLPRSATRKSVVRFSGSEARPTKSELASPFRERRGELVIHVLGIKQLDRSAGHDGRDRVRIDELRLSISPEQQAEIVEPGDDSL